MNRIIALLVTVLLVGCASTLSEKPERRIVELATERTVVPDEEVMLVYLPPGSDVATGAQQLVEILTVDNARGVVAVIGSEDTTMMGQVIRDALPRMRNGALKGALLLYVGSYKDEQFFETEAERLGAAHSFSRYR